MVDRGPATLRVEPASIELTVDLALPAPAASMQVFVERPNSETEDVTADARFSLEGAPLGALANATLTSDGLTGGAATVRITYDGVSTEIPATAHVAGRRIIDGSPAGVADAFASATPTPFDAHLDPLDGAVLPPNLGRMVLAFAANDLDDAHQILVTAPYLDLAIVAPGAAGPRQLELSFSEWAAITHTARGSAIQVEVASLQSSAPATARVTTVGLEIADLDAGALLAGGVESAGQVTDGDVNRPALWRYDMHAGTAAQLSVNPAGACIGCHLAVSADGTRIAALIVSPTAPNLNGVVLDGRAGTVVAQSNPAASPWATAAFDPSGSLLAGWQGSLTLRDPDTGAPIAPIAMTDAAAAPAISADGTALAYVSLDGPPSAAASQPVGNALRIRPWSAAQRSVGAPIELVRDAGGVVLPAFSSDGRWIAFGHTAIAPDRILEVPTSSAAVRTDGSGTQVTLTSDPLDQLAHWASPIAPARAGNRAPEPMVWIAFMSTRPVGGNATSPQQLWLEAFYPERGVIAPAFHLPGQPATLQLIHGPIALPR